MLLIFYLVFGLVFTWMGNLAALKAKLQELCYDGDGDIVVGAVIAPEGIVHLTAAVIMTLRCWLCGVRRLVRMGIWFPGPSYLSSTFNNYVLLRIASGWYCRYGRFDIVAITVGKITVSSAGTVQYYIYRRQNYKHNSNFIPKTVANLIEPKVWPL